MKRFELLRTHRAPYGDTFYTVKINRPDGSYLLVDATKSANGALTTKALGKIRKGDMGAFGSVGSFIRKSC